MVTSDKVVVELQAKLDRYNADVLNAQRRFETSMDRVARSSLKAESQVLRTSTAIKGAFAGLGAVFGISELIRYADTWSDLSSRVGNAAGSMQMAEPIMEKLSVIARRTYSDLGQTAEAYISNATTLRELGYNTQDVIDYTEALNNALVISGAKADVATSVLDALSKAMALGKLQGDNLNTVIARGGRVAEALAASMGVSTLELRKLGSEGKITRKELFDITKQMEQLRKEADEMPATVGDAFTLLRNSILEWVGGMDQASQSSAKVAEAIILVADNFGELADAALNVATILAGALAGKALTLVVTAAGNAVTSVAALVAALRAGTIAAATFTAALGPIAALAGAAAAGVYLLTTRQSNAAAAAERFEEVIDLNAKALDNAKDASGRYSQALRDQIALQLEAAKAAEALANATFEAANARAQSIRELTGLKFAPFEYAANQAQAEADALTGAVLQIEQQLARIDDVGVSRPVVPDLGGDKDNGSKKTAAERENEYERLTQSITDRTAAIIAETEAMRQLDPTIEDYGYALEKARAEQELLNAAQKAGIAVTPELRAQIAQTAEQFALATMEANQLAEAQDNIKQRAEEWRDTQKDALRGIVDDLIAGKSAADAFASALQKIADKLLDMAFDDLFSGLFKTGGGGGGIFGSIGKIFGFAEGGYTGSGGKYQPAGVVHRGEYVFDQDSVRRAGGPAALDALRRGLKGYAGGGFVGGGIPSVPAMPRLSPASSGGGANITFAPVIDARGADSEAVARLAQEMERQQREFSANVLATMRRAKATRQWKE